MATTEETTTKETKQPKSGGSGSSNNRGGGGANLVSYDNTLIINDGKQSSETIVSAYILSYCLSQCLKISSNNVVKINQITFSSKVKFQATYHCKIDNKKDNINKLKHDVQMIFNKLVDQSLAVSTSSSFSSNSIPSNGIKDISTLNEFKVEGIENCYGYSIVRAVDNTAKLIGCKILKINYKEKKEELEIMAQIGKGTRQGDGDNDDDDINGGGGGSSKKKQYIGNQSIVDQYRDKILSHLLDQLEHSKIISQSDFPEHVKESLADDLQECLTQFQNIAYTRGLFAAQGKKVL